MGRINGDEFDLRRLSLLFSALFAETMGDDDIVELDLPEIINGKLDLFGARLKHGRVIVNGDLGDYAGYRMEDLAQLHVRGSVGDYAAAYSSGLASLSVEGDAGEHFAHGAADETTFDVLGEITSVAIMPGFRGEITAGSIKKTNIAKKKLASQLIIKDV